MVEQIHIQAHDVTERYWSVYFSDKPTDMVMETGKMTFTSVQVVEYLCHFSA